MPEIMKAFCQLELMILGAAFLLGLAVALFIRSKPKSFLKHHSLPKFKDQEKL